MPMLHRRSPIPNRVPLTPPFHQFNRRMSNVERRILLTPIKMKLDDSFIESDDDWEVDDDLQRSTYKILAKKLRCPITLSTFILFVFALVLLHESIYKVRLFPRKSIPHGYLSREEMLRRNLRFPSVDDRVKLYMSSWYTQPCTIVENVNDTSESQQHIDMITQFNFLHDSTDEPPILLLREANIVERNATATSSRVFLIDSNAEAKGSRIFFMSPSEIRKCDHSFCLDTQSYLFPSLQRLQGTDHWHIPKRKWKVPILMQFGDAEISRAFRLLTKKNETYPNVPLIKKFRYSMNQDELRRLTIRGCYDTFGDRPRDIPVTRKGDRRLQPSTYLLIGRFHNFCHYKILKR
jgi:hypothetical protein